MFNNYENSSGTGLIRLQDNDVNFKSCTGYRQLLSCKLNWSKGNIQNSPLPHTLTYPSTFNSWCRGCRMCWRYTLALCLLVYIEQL